MDNYRRKRQKIEAMFCGKAFKNSLFYNYEGGLRFELAEGKTYISCFLSAHRKAKEICDYIFKDSKTITTCFTVYGEKNLMKSLSFFRSLHEMGFEKEDNCEHWFEPINEEDNIEFIEGLIKAGVLKREDLESGKADFYDGKLKSIEFKNTADSGKYDGVYELMENESSEEFYNHYFVFNAPLEYLDMLLWIPFAADFGFIEPRANCDVRLFDLEREIIVWPYDDRGMDVVGNDHALLKELYHKFNHYLLDHDRETMDKTFLSK